MLLWAYGVNRSLEAGGEPDDGLAIMQQIYNFTFDGVVGPVTIDHKGDRKGDYAIYIMQPGFQVCTSNSFRHFRHVHLYSGHWVPMYFTDFAVHSTRQL